MTPNQIRRRLATITKHQLKWDTEERILQEKCPHTNVTKKYNGSTGNWDRSQDSYWIEYSCPDCKKFWTVEQ
jgi:hypothetical protein